MNSNSTRTNENEINTNLLKSKESNRIPRNIRVKKSLPLINSMEIKNG
jgi:hypothetical protein